MMRTSLAAQRGATQRLLAASGLPLMTEDDEAAYANLNQVIPQFHDLPVCHIQFAKRFDANLRSLFVCLLQVIDEWTAQLRPISGRFFKSISLCNPIRCCACRG